MSSRLKNPRFVVSLLLLALVVGPAFGRSAKGKSRLPNLPVLSLELPTLALEVPAMRPVAVKVEQQPWARAPIQARYGSYYHGCGGRYVPMLAAHEFSLVDPIAVMSDAYLNCRVIAVDVLASDLTDSDVTESAFPVCALGASVGEVVPVMGRREISNSGSLRELFSLLAEAIGDPEEPMDFWVEVPDSTAPMGDYLRDTSFEPELLVEFVGGRPLQVQISWAQRRIMVQAGDYWDGYELDAGAARALQKYLRITRS